MLVAAWRWRCGGSSVSGGGGGAQRDGGSAVAAARWLRRWRQRDILTLWEAVMSSAGEIDRFHKDGFPGLLSPPPSRGSLAAAARHVAACFDEGFVFVC
jgi:CelD/BcsL family acetyltransferase involved in cellulose biosynthesis